MQDMGTDVRGYARTCRRRSRRNSPAGGLGSQQAHSAQVGSSWRRYHLCVHPNGFDLVIPPTGREATHIFSFRKYLWGVLHGKFTGGWKYLWLAID